MEPTRSKRRGGRAWKNVANLSVLAIALLGAIGGATAGYLTHIAVKQSETTEFCISCHIMDATVFEEFKQTRHYSNAIGFRVECGDCHVPSVHSMGELVTYLSVKFGAARFVYGWATGRMSEPDQLRSKRDVLAQRVWDDMRARDSAECRSCHRMEAMDLSLQSRRGAEQHRDAEAEGQTCIDCHNDGIAHTPVKVEKTGKEEEEWGEDAFMIE